MIGWARRSSWSLAVMRLSNASVGMGCSLFRNALKVGLQVSVESEQIFHPGAGRNRLFFALFAKGQRLFHDLAYSANRAGEMVIHARGEFLHPGLDPADKIVSEPSTLHVQLFSYSSACLGQDSARMNVLGRNVMATPIARSIPLATNQSPW